jgi:hypothetical protein
MAKAGEIPGWTVTGPGDYAPDFELRHYAGGFADETHAGQPSVWLCSTVPHAEEHGVIMQRIRSDKYRAKRIRFAAWVKSDGVEQWGGLWVRVVPRDDTRSYAHGRAAATGTTDWQELSVTVEVAADSSYLLFGLALHGNGKVWMSGPSFQVLGDAQASLADVPLEPRNLALQK